MSYIIQLLIYKGEFILMDNNKISDLLYSIGETIILEINDIKSVNYNKSEFPDIMIIELQNGKKFELHLRPFGEY